MLRRPNLIGRLSQSEDDCRNIVVDVMARLRADGFARLARFAATRKEKPNLPFMAWLVVVAQRVAIDYMRAHGEYRDRRHEEGASSPGAWFDFDTMPADDELGKVLTAGDDNTIRLFSVGSQDALSVFQRKFAGSPIALDEQGTRAFIDGRLVALTPDQRPASVIAARVAERVPYALDAGRLVVKVPTGRLVGSLPPPGLPPGARPACGTDAIPHGAVFPFGHVAWCQGLQGFSGSRTVWSPTGMVIDRKTYGEGLEGVGMRGFYAILHQSTFDQLGRLASDVVREGTKPSERFRLRGFEDGHLVREEMRDASGTVGSKRLWHGNGALAEQADYPVCLEKLECLERTIHVTTFDDEGHKRSEGKKRSVFVSDPWPVGSWSFWNRRGDETRFDFGCPRGRCD